MMAAEYYRLFFLGPILSGQTFRICVLDFYDAAQLLSLPGKCTAYPVIVGTRKS